MSFIVATEKRHWRTKLLFAGMYTVAIIGALTMIYPFMIMLSGSVKSTVDFDDFEAIPSYLRDDEVLYRKFVHARYNANQARWQLAVGSMLQSWDQIAYPREISEQANRDLAEFMASDDCPRDFLSLGQIAEIGGQPRWLRAWRDFLARRFDGNIDRVNRAMGTSFDGWDKITVPEPAMYYPGNKFSDSPLEKLFREEFRPTIPWHEFWPVNADAVYYCWLWRRFGGEIAPLNRAAGTDFVSFDQVPLPRTKPPGPLGDLWQAFVDKGLNAHFVAADGSIDSFDFRYRDYLARKYESIDRCAAAHGRSYASFDTIPLKLDEFDAYLMLQRRGEIVREFLARNYLFVFDFIFRHGNALKVTALYVGLNVLLHLLINPMAAYALSRYKLRIGHWILLLCVLTMAFPAEVGSIPRFLLIRELGMLNTIWALLLPGIAHGFSIFILKSFFDGLPQELYEAAILENASERWMFWNITLALTKPILAVTAFGAFTSAYGAFLFALIICPDEKMWTISVWLYQFQQNVTDPVRFASLVVASVPVLIAFLLMQRFILRGIVLPVER